MPINKPTRYRLDLSYDGTEYNGWQKQPDCASIQERLEFALERLFKAKIATQGSGRTDAGVHARQQVVHFDFEGETEHYNLVRGLNRFLPESIVVQSAYACPNSFHALRDTQSKTYQYRVLGRPNPDPLRGRYAHWLQALPELDYLNQLSQNFVGRHDFAAFQTSGTEVKTTIREIYEASWSYGALKDEVIFTISGNGFLKQMVRNIVGTLLDGYWEKRHSSESIQSILASKSRQKAGSTAPAKGLCLFQVNYPPDLDKRCRKL